MLPIFKEMESYQGDGDDEYRGRNGPLQGQRKQRERSALRRADQGGRRGRHRLHEGLQRRAAGRHRHDPDDDPRRSSDEHRRVLSRPGAPAPEPEDPGQCVDRMPAVRRQALRRRALQSWTGSNTRPAPAGKSSSAPARSIRRSCWNCPASASRRCCKAAGIEVRHELSGVGENLRDHYSPRMKWAVPHALGMTYNAKARGLGMAWQALRYATDAQGAAGPAGGADPRLCPHPRRARCAGRRDLVDPVSGRRQFPAGEGFRRHRDHEHPALGKHRQHSRDVDDRRTRRRRSASIS